MTDTIIPRGRRWVPALVLAGIAIILYANTLPLNYALDDTLILTGNEFTKQGIGGIPEILTNDAFTGFFGKQKSLVAGGRYRPLSQIMFALEYEFFGFNPMVGHLMNILLYALLAIVLYLLLLRLFKPAPKQWWTSVAFLATAFYIAHPLHTEAVANIKGRDEILSMLLASVAWYYGIVYWDNKKYVYLILSGAALFMALMAKENSITFIAVIPLSLLFFRKPAPKSRLLVVTAPLMLATGAFLGLRFNALGFFLGDPVAAELLNNPYLQASGAEKIATNLLTWGRYLYLLLIPCPLTHDYYPHFFTITGMGNLTSWIVLAMVVGLLVLSLRLFSQRHPLSFAILYFFITFSIVSNVVFNIGTFMNERFLFMPLLGFSLFTAWGIGLLGRNKVGYKLPIALSAVLLLTYGILTVARNPAWADDYTLFTTDVKTSSNSIKCNVSAGGKSLEKYERSEDEAERSRLLGQAIPWLEKGVSMHPTYLAGWEQLGKAYFYSKDIDRAWIAYSNCLRIKRSESAATNLGLVADLALREKDYPRAVRYLSEMTRIDSVEALHPFRLADAYIALNKVDSALIITNQGLVRMPGNALLLGKAGEIYGRYLQRLDLAEQYLTRSVEADPGYVTSVENLGIVYGMTGRMERSLELLKKALELEPDNPRIMTNIGNTLRTMGREQEAEEYFKHAAVQEAK
ncbi:MAG TPA: tetratricopeptide repeat protein [Bacteroidales bacterium]|nr:tetratricopeptide repeat protein [Bacteroidales bacterium]